ncbi:MAG: GNAT family N-acetyltransferase [Dysgonomonas sp.]
MIEIRQYISELKNDWDEFISLSKNGTFILQRDFMEYHSHRFQDYSLLFYIDDKLIALLPANKVEDTLYSHSGLTYGGLILTEKSGAALVLQLMENLIAFLKKNQFRKLIYKPIPLIYHKQAAEEDLYALFRLGARLTSRSISSTIFLRDRIKYTRDRRRAISKANKYNLKVQEASDFSLFWELLNENLEDRHQVKPVHSLDEITYLKSKFPDHIRLFYSYNDEHNILGGVLVFDMGHIIHVQYISPNKEGRALGGVDIVFDYLYSTIYPDRQYFDFGISTENGGMYLNEGLIAQKEGFGGRGTVYDAYEIDIK